MKKVYCLTLFLIEIFLLVLMPIKTVEGAPAGEKTYNGTGKLVSTYEDGKLYH
ncbi:MAG: hypothetical protein U1D70_12615 [Methylobacter sp.]|nr:hypothetical protein [Methylobacter sp.]